MIFAYICLFLLLHIDIRRGFAHERMKLRESHLLLIATIIGGLAAIFTLIGLTTPKWLSDGFGLWNCKHVCSPAAATLSILALFMLVASVIFLILILNRLFPRSLRFLPFSLAAIATLFLLAATASYLRHLHRVGYSFELMVTAHTFALITTVLLAFWYGRTLEDKPATLSVPTANPTFSTARVS